MYLGVNRLSCIPLKKQRDIIYELFEEDNDFYIREISLLIIGCNNDSNFAKIFSISLYLTLRKLYLNVTKRKEVWSNNL